MHSKQNHKSTILNAKVDRINMHETISSIEKSILENRPIQHVVVNAGKLVGMQDDYDLYKSVVGCDIINADGQSIVWASKFLGDALPERVAGIDLMQSLVELSHKKGFRCFFLGAKEDVVSRVVQKYEKQFSSKIIAGYRNGYFSEDEEQGIAEQISKSNADVLFVAITSPKKEIFLNRHKDLINTPFIMGVGGSFDVVAGVTKRAPRWMQKVGLEWFYRLIQEPGRMWKRYLIGNSKFVYLVLLQKFGLYRNPFRNTTV